MTKRRVAMHFGGGLGRAVGIAHLSIHIPDGMGQTASVALPSSLPDLALHVLRTAEDSPSFGMLEPFFDYLVGLSSSSAGSQQALSTEALGEILAENEDGRVVLKVYNAKSQRIRGE